MATTITPDWSALGQKRLAICEKAKSLEDWKRLWFDAPHDYPFQYGDCWNFCTEYKVTNFESEVGFFTDGLCLSSYVLQKDFAMFTDDTKSFFMSFVPAGENPPTSGESFNLGFMVKDIQKVVAGLASRGIDVDRDLEPPYPGVCMLRATILTPNGIPIILWGMTDAE